VQYQPNRSVVYILLDNSEFPEIYCALLYIGFTIILEEFHMQVVSFALVSYVYGSVHRWPILIIVHRDAKQSGLFIILQVHSTCFGCQPHPSSGVHKTVTTSSGTGRTFCAATCLQRGQGPRWRQVAAQKIRPVPEDVVTVLCTPDDGCGWHPKHVEWTCRIMNRPLCFASRWTIINNGLIFYHSRSVQLYFQNKAMKSMREEVPNFSPLVIHKVPRKIR